MRPSVKPPALKPTQVGRHCEQDSECGAGRCLTARDDTLLGGGAGANVCVLDCTSDAALCDGYSRELVCVQTTGAATQSNSDDRAYCFEGCRIGDERSAKCSGRTQLACDASFEESGELDAAFCRPLCFEDADCDLGECDLGRGVCTPTGRDGQALGAPCGPKLGSCAGLCLAEAGIQYCSQRCVLGQSGQCGADGFCGVYGAPDSADGDLGYCQQTCDCNADCDHPEAVCAPDPFSAGITGRTGVCVSELLAEGPGVPCPITPAADAGVDTADAGVDTADSGVLVNPTDAGQDAAFEAGR